MLLLEIDLKYLLKLCFHISTDGELWELWMEFKKKNPLQQNKVIRTLVFGGEITL